MFPATDMPPITTVEQLADHKARIEGLEQRSQEQREDTGKLSNVVQKGFERIDDKLSSTHTLIISILVVVLGGLVTAIWELAAPKPPVAPVTQISTQH